MKVSKLVPLSHPVEGAVNVNIINVYVEIGKIIRPADSTRLIYYDSLWINMKQ